MLRLGRLSPLSPDTLAETLDGGQCFRWRPGNDGSWRGVSGRMAAGLRVIAPRLEHGTGDRGQESEINPLPPEIHATMVAGDPALLAHHLADDVDWRALADRLPWRSDPHLARCIEAFPGLRILRQPLAETLLCFLCSATKQIAQIRQMTDALALEFGEAIAPRIHILPTWARLAGSGEDDLRRCRLGFRARFIARTAQRLASAPGWLDETAALPYSEAKERLMQLPGVGEKIADCALLFGAEKLEAFPVDVWLLRAMARHYGLENWAPGQIAHFGRVHFGPLAGLAQQYLFAWERRFGARGG